MVAVRSLERPVKAKDAREGTEAKQGPERPSAEAASTTAIAVREPTLEDPDVALSRPPGNKWSSEPPDSFDFLLACCCPCVVVGWNWRDAKIGRFAAGFVPIGLVVLMLIIMTALPYLAGAGACSYPQVRFENDVIARFFNGECSTVEYAALPLARVFYVVAACLLFYQRRRLAAQLGILEKPCPALFCQCCCCYACLLATELRTVRESLKRQDTGSVVDDPLPVVGAPVMASTSV
mmetsp:Transcript_11958/g.27094  ORF Transcript_11958/g.27094 Transcript_11958/m.27094 type:complete len:236 (-) Transcript_11958:138-845(-)